MSEVFITIYQILFYITEFVLLYNGLLYIIGIFCLKDKYPMVEDKKKFCLFVPCHNEGEVVRATVENYVNINYNKDLFNIYFIADNCTDNTAEVLRSAIKDVNQTNFFVLERNDKDRTKQGKPHALRWGIEQLENKDEFYNKYDMFMIFDADNFVDPDILKHINSQYLSYKDKKKPVMIQAYLDCKNKKGLIARGYFETYRIMNGFWQYSKHKLGLAPAIGGTGFAITTDFLKSIGGFNCTSLTEDLEIQTLAIMKNQKIAFNANVRVYDEKPTRLKASIVQRIRWAQGHWYLFFKYVPILLLQLFNFKTIKSTFRKIDMALYLANRSFILLGVVLLFINIALRLWFGVPQIISPTIFYINTIIFFISMLCIPLASLYYGSKEEKQTIVQDFIPNLISIYLITVIDIISSTIGLFKCGNQKVWKKTTHKITHMQEGEDKVVTPKTIMVAGVTTSNSPEADNQQIVAKDLAENQPTVSTINRKTKKQKYATKVLTEGTTIKLKIQPQQEIVEEVKTETKSPTTNENLKPETADDYSNNLTKQQENQQAIAG